MKCHLFFVLCFPLLLMAEHQVLDLQELGKVIYHFEDEVCTKIIRISSSGEVKYEHLYHYDNEKRLVGESLIGGLGEIEYSGRVEEGQVALHTPFGEETWSKEDYCNFEEIDIERVYDSEGRLIQKGSDRFFYRENKLALVIKDLVEVYFAYDKEGRRVSKKTLFKDGESEEIYLFWGQNEIGSFSKDGELIWLRIPGMTIHPNMVRAIAIETRDATYAPIYDQRWNIVKLVNIEDGTIRETRPDPFGQNLGGLNGCPWTFCSKRYDPEVGLVNFGHRDYDPDLCEWTSLDPLKQDDQSYRYCFNNPMQYIDPDGQFVVAIPIIGGGIAIGQILFDAAVVGTVYVGYKGYEMYQEWEKRQDKYFDQLEYDTIEKMYRNPNTYFYEKTLESLGQEKKEGCNFPERELPRDGITKEPLPDCDKPHTQLGIKQGSKGKYSQAREFDKHGKPVKDIDFTDHGRPSTHANPHVHEYKENETGGTRQRGPAQPLNKERN